MSQTVELHYTRRGDGPALLVVHGLYGSGTNWNSQAQWLAERFSVILPDLRNHGRSPQHPDMSYPAMAADLLALLDKLQLESALVLGHSMGGKAAMTLALTQPGRVRALVSADIAPVTYRHGRASLAEALLALPLQRLESRKAVDSALAAAIPSTMVRQFLLTNLERGPQGYRWRIPLQTLIEQMPLIEGFPPLDDRYEGPALFLHGADSDYVTSGHEAAIRRYFPAAEIAAIAGAGHWLHVEQPAAFADRLGAFLAPFAG